MNKINWREPHEYHVTPWDGEDILCACGLPEDNPLHIKSLTKEYEDGVTTYTDIDKQADRWIKEQLGTAGDNQKLRNLLHQIYSQAKAEGYQAAIEDMNEDKAYKENKL